MCQYIRAKYIELLLKIELNNRGTVKECTLLFAPGPILYPLSLSTGFGEAGGALIDRIAGESLEGCSACLMVMAYTMLRDEADMEILRQLHSSDPGL